MIIPTQSLSSSVSLNDVVFNPNSLASGLNPLSMNVMPFGGLRGGSAKAQGKMAGCELLVVFDARVSDLPTLLGAVVEGAGCYVLSEDEDAITVITQLLAQTGARRLALVAHGEPGVLHVGAYPLDEVQLQGQSRLLQEWGVEEIALYSCEVANEEKGQSFVAQMRELTGATVGASTTHVGNGRWVLDVYGAEATSIQLAFTSVVLSQYTATLTAMRYSINYHFSDQSANVNGTLYFSGTDFSNSVAWSGLFKIDSNGSPVRVIDPSTGNSPFTDPANLTNVDGTLYFRAYSDSNGYEIWKIDPLTGNPILLEVVAGRGSYYPDNLTSVNGTLYFTAPSYGFTIYGYSQIGYELWKIEPSNSSPTKVPYSYSASSFTNLTSVNGTLYFSNGYEIWKIDPNGTPVKFTDLYGFSNLTNVNGLLYLVSQPINFESQLWKIDPSGTSEKIADIAFGYNLSNPAPLMNVNGTLYYFSANSGNGSQLWKIDPSNGVPARVTGSGGTQNGFYYPQNLTNLNGRLYFSANSQLWTIDPSNGIPVLLEIGSEYYISDNLTLTNVGGVLYFNATTASNGTELWKINPSDPLKPWPVKDFFPGPTNSDPRILGFQNGILYVSATDSDFTNGLWSIDLNNVTPPELTGSLTSLSPGFEDTRYIINLSDLLIGFTDTDGTLSVTGLSANSGSLTYYENNGIIRTSVFTPSDNFNGTVNLSYFVMDGNGGSVAATQTFEIAPVNDFPTGAASAILPENVATINASDLLVGFSDIDGDALSLYGLRPSEGDITNNNNGTYTFTLPSDITDPSYNPYSGYFDRYRYNYNYNVTFDLFYTVFDGNGGYIDAKQSLSFSNSVPIGYASAVLPDGTEDTNYIINTSDLLAGFSDYDDDVLSVSNLIASFINANGYNVYIENLAKNSNGNYSFTPVRNFNGTVELSYNVIDGKGGSVSAWQTLNLAAVNDAPTGTARAILPDDVTTIYAWDLLEGFSDVDDDTLVISNLTSPNGTITDNGDDTYTFTFTPSPNFNGVVNLSYSVIDGNGGSLAATQSFNLAVFNHPPTGTASAILAAGTEGTNYIINAVDLLVGFSDVDGDSLYVSDLTATNGAITNNNDGTYTFIPVASYNGIINLSYSVIDGNGGSIAATQSFNLATINHSPTGTASAILAVGTEDTTYIINATDLLLGFSDIDGDTLAVSGLTSNNGSLINNNNGTYTFTPTANYNGTANLSYNVVDGKGGSIAATQSFSLTPVNDAPTGTASGTLVTGAEDTVYIINAADLLLGFTDVDADTLSIFGLTATNGSITDNNDGTYTFTPVENYNGTVSLAYSVMDGNGSSINATQAFSLMAVNDAPTGTAIAILANGTEDIAYTVTKAQLLQGFSDVDGDTLSITNFISSNGTVLENPDGSFTLTPVLNFNGSVSISYDVIDGNGGSVNATQSFFVEAVNDAAVITGISSGLAIESGSSNSGGTPTVIGDLNATDVDNPSDAWQAIATVTNSVNGYGTYTLTANGLWTYNLKNTNSVVQSLNNGDTLTDTFIVQTVDGTPQTVSITINGANDAPIITSLSDDTGASLSDRITKDNTLTLTGTAEANSTIQLFNGSTALGTATTSNLGIWSLTTSTLSDGTYNLTAKATDAAGNTSAPSIPLSVTVDTTVAAPTVSLAIDSGSSSTDKITNSGIVNVGGLETGASWEYSINNGTTWATGTGTSFTLVGNGTKNVLVRQTDLAGNISSHSVPFIFTLDTTAPNKVATVTSMTLDSGTSATDFLTNDGSTGRIYNGTLSAALAVDESLQVSVDGGTIWGNASVSSTNWSFTDNIAKSSNWTIQTRVVDTAGNGNIRSRAVTLDQQISAASAVTLDLATASDTGVSATDNLTTVVKPTFAVTFDNTKAQTGDILEIRQGATLLGSVTLSAAQATAGTANITLTTNLTSGVNTLSAVHRDAAGNSVTGSTPLAVTQDQQISAASTVTLDLLASSDSGSSTTDNLTNVALSTFAIAFDATKAQAGDIVEVRKGTAVLGSTTLTATQVSAGIANVTLTTALTSGSNILSAVHRDPAGNSVIGSSTLAVTLDTTAPVAATVNGYTSTSIVGTTEPNATVLLSASASAPTTFAATATAAANGNYTLNTSALAGSSAGTTYYLYAQDVVGNLSTVNSSQKVIVGTAGADTLINVGSTAGDLLVGGLGTDTAQYAVASNAISLTGQITGANITSGSINIRTANIDVLTGIETLQFAGSGYSGVGTGATQLRSGVQTSLGNNSIAAFTGAYDAATGIFTLGSSPSNNATLVAFDSNSSGTTNYETFLLLDKTSIVGGLNVIGGTVTLGL
jgi:VCBS repeat-containing protein/ELWxxDGT repeat protein